LVALIYTKGKRTMDWKLELVPIPVSDVDCAKAFYTEKVGFNEDLDVNATNDHRVSDEMRVEQLDTPRVVLLDRNRDWDRRHAAGLCQRLAPGRLGYQHGASELVNPAA